MLLFLVEHLLCAMRHSRRWEAAGTHQPPGAVVRGDEVRRWPRACRAPSQSQMWATSRQLQAYGMGGRRSGARGELGEDRAPKDQGEEESRDHHGRPVL